METFSRNQAQGEGSSPQVSGWHDDKGPLSNTSDGKQANALSSPIERIARRAEAESPKQSVDLLFSSYILAGKHHDRGVLQAIYERVLKMSESVAYDMILEEGAIAQTHDLLTQMGRRSSARPRPSR